MPAYEGDLPPELIEQLARLVLEGHPVRFAEDEDVDVARRVVITARVGAEDEREVHASLRGDDVPDPCGDSDRARVQLSQRSVERVSSLHVPHAQRAHTAARNETLSLELLQGEMHGPRRTFDATDELARVELLSGRAC